MSESSSSSLNARGALSVATLRRSSSHLTPTRTLALSEVEQQLLASARETSPSIVAVQALQARPRSNQRTRTPRRYESPLEPGAFRRGSSPEHGEAVEVQPRVVLHVGDRGTQRTSTRPISEVPLVSACKV